MQQNKDSSEAKSTAWDWDSEDILHRFSNILYGHTLNEESTGRKNRRALMSRLITLLNIDDSAPSTSSHNSNEVTSPPSTNSGEKLTLKKNEATFEENAPEVKPTHPISPTKLNGENPKRTNQNYSPLSKLLPVYHAAMKRKFTDKAISEKERISRQKNNFAARACRYKQKLALQLKKESFVHLVLVRRSLELRLKATVDNFWFLKHPTSRNTFGSK